VIANPMSGAGSTGRRWRRIEARLRDVLGALEVEHTRGPRDAARLAREGVRAGVERIVVAGGDGTLSEVAAGLLSAGLGGYAEIACLPLGTGGDFARTAGLPRDLDAAIEVARSGKPRPIDAARVRFRGRGGREDTAFCVNVASLGVSGLVVELVNRTNKALGGTASFLLGTVRAIASWRCHPVRLCVDGELLHDGPLVLAAAANGGYFGGGMRVAPQARCDDGLLDVVVVSELSRAGLLRRLPTIYRGTHLRDAAVLAGRGSVVEADAEPGSVPLEIDGEPLGTLPARIDVLPGALVLLGPAA
jgi:YegS/Rv2252/BmrU family lipid kinase